MPIQPNLALQVQQPEQPDILGSYGKVLTLADMVQGNQMRRQAMEQQARQTELENEQMRRQQAEQRAIGEALADGGPSKWDGSIEKLRRLGTPTALKYAADLEKTINEHRKAQLDAEDKELEIGSKKAAAFGQIAGAVTDENSLAVGLRQAVAQGLLPKEQAAEYLARPWDDSLKSEIAQFAQQSMTVAQQAQERRNKIAEERAAKAAPFEQRKLEAETLTAERTAKEGPRATGELAEFKEIFAPGYYQQKGIAQPTAADALAAYKEFQSSKRQLVPGRDIPLPPAVEAQRKRMEASRAANEEGLSPSQQSRIQVMASQFDNYQPVKDYNVAANKAEGMRQIINAGLGGPADLAFVFDFMKGLDPNSVVRESEYATAAKSGNLFKGALAKFNGYFNEHGGFLPEQVRKDFLAIVDKKLEVSAKQVKGLYNDRARRIEEITGKPGTGKKYLTDYTEIMGSGASTEGGAKRQIKILSVE